MARAAEGRMRHRTMAEYALAELREAIILGELPAGTPLRLDELARSLGMSISPIREAVRQLEALGLAKHVPHQGARVLDFDIDELRDLFEVRLALDGDLEVPRRELGVGVVADDDDVLVITEGGDDVADPLLGPTAPIARHDVEHAHGAR